MVCVSRRPSGTAKPSVLATGLNALVKVGTNNPRKDAIISKTLANCTGVILSRFLGGWDPITGEFEKEINAQIDLAFANVERCIKDAGGKGWSQVYRVNSYHVPINNEALGAMVRNLKKYMPDHQPIWTCVGVPRLGEDDMRVEIEVVAHDPEGAKAAGTA